MADRDRALVGVPTALVAVLLAGTFLRPETEPPQPRPAVAPAAETRAAGRDDSPPLKQLRPVMQLLGQSLGQPVDPDAQIGAASAALAEWEDKGSSAGAAFPDPSAFLKERADPCGPAELEAGAGSVRPDALDTLARIGSRAGDLRSDAVPKAYASKKLIADLEPCADRRAMANLVEATRAQPFDVDFLIAVIPDYVDSSSGWRADQVIGAIQSAMSDNRFVLDRFRLIDWVRADKQASTEVSSNSRLHELQPGAIIFRRDQSGRVSLRVLLLVLETPTGGIHRRSLRNAIQFLETWNDLAGVRHDLRIIGPGFSGSVLSLALELRNVQVDKGETRGSFPSISVVSTATADQNLATINTYAPHVRFSTTTRLSSESVDVLGRALGRLNPQWGKGTQVALLTESNTAFGSSVGKEYVSADTHWTPEFKFQFPLHIAQLMSDIQSAAVPAVSLLPSSAVPLTLRESAPPADQIPALRPQLTSPIVENEINGILDKIHHQRVTAVGIVATDERDVLFLARLLKRRAPNVQLFLTASNLLYLHSEYLPYMRGTLVASTYPLYLPVQTQFGCGFQYSRFSFFCSAKPATTKRLFQSTVAEAVYNATQKQIGGPTLLDYCGPSAASYGPCSPPVWISIIGDDGFWPVDWQSLPARPPVASFVAGTRWPVTVMPPPPSAWIVALLLLGVIATHVGIVMFVWARLPCEGSLRQFQASPFVRVLATPITYFAASRNHALALLFGFAVLAALTMWVSGILWMHAALAFGWPRAVAVACTLACGATVIGPALLVHRRSKQFPADDLLPTRLPAGRRDAGGPASDRHGARRAPATGLGSVLTLLVMSGLLVATLAFFLAFLKTAFVGPNHVLSENKDLWLALELDRFASGGIASPAWLVLCVFAAVYTLCFAALRRISLLGGGYTALAAESETFRLLAGAPIRASARSQGTQAAAVDLPLVRMLDMPAQNLPWPYPVAMIGLLLITLAALPRPHTVEGQAFSAFLICGSALIVCSAFLQLAQAVEIWRRLRPGLTALAHSRLEPALSSVAAVVRWNLSLVSPHLSDLEPLASLADRLYGRLVALAGRTRRDRRWNDHETSSGDTVRYAELLEGFLRGSNLEGLVRPDDLSPISPVTRPKQLAGLREEMAQRQYAPLLQSRTWFRLWDTSDRLVGILDKLHWHRYEPIGERRKEEKKDSHDGSEPEDIEDIRQEAVRVVRQTVLAGASAGNIGPRVESDVVDVPVTVVVVQQDRRKKPHEKGERERQLASWLSDAETLIALQCALVLRDILARVMSCLFTSMLCLTLLSAGHLLYLFQGRSSLLAVDLVAVTLAAGIAIWLLVAMERDTVLSRLRHTTPGRVDINWEFLKRIGIYGVLPLIAVLGSLFPEIQQPLLGWLDPLRKLVNF
jgi:hypothetical protein